jgi:tRNA1Val (adenine37-N6)-methyltransferase
VNGAGCLILLLPGPEPTSLTDLLMPTNADDWTYDALFDGALTIRQRRRGFRFGLDSLLLATDLPELEDHATVVELGAGQGAVSLSVAYLHPMVHVIALERQPSLLELLRENVAANGLTNVTVVAGDLREHRFLLSPHSADLVLANPPFFRAGERRRPQDSERAAARHELHGTVEDFLTAAAFVLHQRGRLQLILPPLRLQDTLAASQRVKDLCLESLRFVHSRPDDDAYLVILRWRRGGAADVRILPPLVIYEEGDHYTPEVARRVGRRSR